jgi:hypothetical protein
MHFKSLLHVRDHAKVRGRAHHLLSYIAQHVNMPNMATASFTSVRNEADRVRTAGVCQRAQCLTPRCQWGMPPIHPVGTTSNSSNCWAGSRRRARRLEGLVR